MAEEEEQSSGGDPRLDFFQDYVLRTFKVKPDKWSKLLGNEEARQALMEFCEKAEDQYLVIYLNSSSQLTPASAFPGSSKNKAVFFVKRNKGALTKDNLRSLLMYGDLSYSPLEHLSALVENVSNVFVLRDRLCGQSRSVLLSFTSMFHTAHAWPTLSTVASCKSRNP